MKEVIINNDEQYLVLLSGNDEEVKKDLQNILKEDKEQENQKENEKK